MNKLKKLISAICLFKRTLSWNLDVLIERLKPTDINVHDSFFKKRKMILIPHADDEWIGCSTILRHADNVVLVDMDMKGGDADDLHKLRKKELKEIADNYSLPLFSVNENKTEALVTLIKESEPDHIFLPFFYDWHEEHIEVMRILKDVIEHLNYKGDIIMYQVSLPIPSRFITNAFSMTKSEWNFKWSRFKEVYRSQLIIPYKRFACHERINGIYCNSFASEVFVLMSSKEWLEKFQELLLRPDQKTKAKQNINDISYIRKYLNSL